MDMGEALRNTTLVSRPSDMFFLPSAGAPDAAPAADPGGGPGMRRVIVWRHGETAHNAGGIYQGHLDTPLSDRGVQQAEAAAQTLAAREVSLLVASDLDRAASTAAALGRRTGVAVRTGHHCAWPLHRRLRVPASTRASFGVYTTTEEIDHFATALDRVPQIFGMGESA